MLLRVLWSGRWAVAACSLCLAGHVRAQQGVQTDVARSQFAARAAARHRRRLARSRRRRPPTPRPPPAPPTPPPRRRYAWRIDGIDARRDAAAAPALRRNCRRSTPTTAAPPTPRSSIAARARMPTLLDDVCCAREGYYDARVTTRVEPGADSRWSCSRPTPGTLYTLRRRDARPASPRRATRRPRCARRSGSSRGDPVNADAIVAGAGAADDRRSARGLPLRQGRRARDRRRPRRPTPRRSTWRSTPGGARALRRDRRAARQPRVRRRIMSQEIARFPPGEPVRRRRARRSAPRADPDRARLRGRRQAGRRAATPGTVDIGVKLDRAPPRTIAGELGYGTGEGARAELSWTHRNLFPPEGALTLRGVLGTQEQLGSARLPPQQFPRRATGC